MKRYYPNADTLAGMTEHPEGSYMLCSEHESIIKRQAAAALAGMDAAKAISSGQLQQAHRLNRESSPEALESERSANALLTEENERLRGLMKGWSSYAWKDGQYIDDVQGYFDEQTRS